MCVHNWMYWHSIEYTSGIKHACLCVHLNAFIGICSMTLTPMDECSVLLKHACTPSLPTACHSPALYVTRGKLQNTQQSCSTCCRAPLALCTSHRHALLHTNMWSSIWSFDSIQYALGIQELKTTNLSSLSQVWPATSNIIPTSLSL